MDHASGFIQNPDEQSQVPGKTDMSKVDLIIHILASLPEEYKDAVSVLEDRFMDTTTHAQLGIKMV